MKTRATTGLAERARERLCADEDTAKDAKDAKDAKEDQFDQGFSWRPWRAWRSPREFDRMSGTNQRDTAHGLKTHATTGLAERARERLCADEDIAKSAKHAKHAKEGQSNRGFPWRPWHAWRSPREFDRMSGTNQRDTAPRE